MAAPTLTQMRQALAARFGTISGLTAYATVPGSVNVPAVLVRPTRGTLVTYGQSMSTSLDGEAVDWTFDCQLLVSFAVYDAAQESIDGYLATTGPQSLAGALEQDPTLGGVVAYAVPISATGYGSIDYDGITYLGCTVMVQVGAP